MTRRRFIRYGSVGLAAFALGGFNPLPAGLRAFQNIKSSEYIDLTIREVIAEMVDLERVPMWAFEQESFGPRIPGPVIFARQGEMIGIRITNHTLREHAFAVPGVVEGKPVLPGQTLHMDFQAPSAGAYLYLDPLNEPINRLMGLHGALVVLPHDENTPYTDPPPRLESLFNDLGSSERFKGEPWKPQRSWIWVFNTIDPLKNRRVQEQPHGTRLEAESFMNGYLPRYFTLNGKSGFFAAHEPENMPSGKVGQPALIRVLNAGVATHSVHIHGNHVFLLAENGKVLKSLPYLDTWSMPPSATKDVLLPFRLPPDIPPGAWPPSGESLPFHYPVHCHTLMSQTAAGGNYPQGLNAHWLLLPD